MKITHCALILLLAGVSGGALFAGGVWAAPASTETGAKQQAASIDKVCANAPAGADDQAKQYQEMLGKTLLLSDDQKKALQDYQDTQTKAIADARTKFCDNKPDPTSFEGGLHLRERMLEQQLSTLKAVDPKLISFYNSLNAEQKSRFDQMREHMSSQKQSRR